MIRPSLAHLTDPAVAPLLAGFAKEVTFAAGEVIYRAGEAADCFYMFARGEVELAAEGIAPWILDARSSIGLLDVLADRPRTFTATAVTEVRAMLVSGDDYLDLLGERFELVVAKVLAMANDVHDISLALAPDGGFGPSPPPTSEPAPRPMDLVKKLLVLRQSPLFRRANVQALVRLTALAREISLPAGATLFRHGEAQGQFFFVAHGVVEAKRQSPEIVARFGRGELVCGHGAIGKADDEYTAQACSPVISFSFSEEDFFDVMEEHFELTRSVLSGLALEHERLFLERERRAALAET
jgi:CRP-like cAMP-binding protein